MRMTYLKNGETLTLDTALCNGCGECIEVCPHAVFALENGKSRITDRATCMECGACARNCASGAITVKPGVGCAAAIIGGILRGSDPTCGAECGCGPREKAPQQAAAAECGCGPRDGGGTKRDVKPLPLAGTSRKGCC